jgi:FKBP-type peptidyl-prolyl cis-trans isomerase
MKITPVITLIVLLNANLIAQEAINRERKAAPIAPVHSLENNPSAASAAPRNAKTEPGSQPAQFSAQEKRGYALGVELGAEIARQGMMEGLTGGKYLMSIDEMSASVNELQKEQRERFSAAVKKVAEKNRSEGEAFLEANKTKDGVTSLASGLQYKVLKSAEGNKPSADDVVVCHYRGTRVDGTEFDSSYKRSEPVSLPVKGVIKGWAEALQMMPVGSKWQLFIPPTLAYGERGARNVGPNATLIFEIELIGIKDKLEQSPKQATLVKPAGID